MVATTPTYLDQLQAHFAVILELCKKNYKNRDSALICITSGTLAATKSRIVSWQRRYDLPEMMNPIICS